MSEVEEHGKDIEEERRDVEAGKQTDKLDGPDSLARLCVVSVIQLVGVYMTIGLIKYGPRIFGITGEVGWQHDCLRIADCLEATVLILLLTLAFGYYFKLGATIPEGVIWLVFGINTVAFSLAMARTGGPAHSFFGQLVPMQLSGILLLEQQKAKMTSKQSTPWGFIGFAGLTWIAVVLFQMKVKGLLGWAETSMEKTHETYENWAGTLLFLLGIVVTAVAYWLPPRPGFIKRFRKD
jgi:hypothetical protein